MEEEVRAGSLEAWWGVSDQSNAVPKRAETLGCRKRERYVLKDAHVPPADLPFFLSICASCTFASSFSLPAIHCQAGALMFNMLFDLFVL